MVVYIELIYSQDRGSLIVKVHKEIQLLITNIHWFFFKDNKQTFIDADGVIGIGIATTAIGVLIGIAAAVARKNWDDGFNYFHNYF